MARELDERDLSRLDNHRDAASSSSDASDLYSSELSGRPAEEPYSGSDEPGVRRESSLTYKGESKRDALSILLRLADALEENGGNEGGQDDYYDEAMDSQLLTSRGKEVSYDLLDTYPGGPYKSRGGSIKRTRFVEEEEEEEDDEEDDAVFMAEPFNAEVDRLEATGRGGKGAGGDAPAAVLPSSLPKEGDPRFRHYVRQSRWSWSGTGIMVVYTLCFLFYMWVRVTKTLDLGKYLPYGILVLIIEIMGATTTLLYGVNLLRHPMNPSPPEDPANPGLPKVNLPYHIRVLVPCYRENLQIVTDTLQAALAAPLPAGCARTVYLCDDGKDRQKRKWCLAMSPDVVYVSGRTRKPGEMNGKSANLNNCLSQIYPEGAAIPAHEIVCIFDADQCAQHDFYLKLVPLLDGGDDVGMVLSPQCFRELNTHTDIFNHANVQFWEYAQHGYDALGFISCTGTNFLIRSAAFREAGWSPEFTLTEDYALGMLLKMNKWHCRYVEEYLALGEAPDNLRQSFQQRSRWCKGHFQIMFSREHCPLFQPKLSIGMRIMYCSGVWSYIVGALTAPLYILIPLLTIWAGMFPIVVSLWAAIGLTCYMLAQTLVLNYVRKPKHIEALWFASIANTILWWTFVKACFNTVLASTALGKSMTFKTTMKGLNKLGQITMGDLGVHLATFAALCVSLGIGLHKLLAGPTVITTLAISVVWIIYAMIPIWLLIWYTFLGRGTSLHMWCRLTFLLTYACSAGALVLLWLVYPQDYSYGAAVSTGLKFYPGLAVGHLPPTNPYPWRGDSLLYEKSTKFGFPDLTGGWMTGGPAGDLKMTMPTAFTVSMLAWGMLAFPGSYARSGNTRAALDSIQWGSDYLMKTFRKDEKKGYLIVYQVGNLTTDVTYWGPPEAMTEQHERRPVYVVNTASGASDLAGSMAGALAASSVVWRSLGNNATYADGLLAGATELYGQAKKFEGSYTAKFKYTCVSRYAKSQTSVKEKQPACVPPTSYANGSALFFYNSTSYRDDLVWAAAWLYKATGEQGYLDDVNRFYSEHLMEEGAQDADLITDWNSMFWAANVLLAEITDEGAFHMATQGMLKQWICATTGKVVFTPKGRAYNIRAPTLGSTANAALLSVIYGQTRSSYIPQAKADRYTCFARSQMRYMLGDSGRSLMSGWGKNPPNHIQNRAASCPSPPNVCNVTAALNATGANPHVLAGALVEFASFSDSFPDVRTLNDTRVSIDNNAGAVSALAGLAVSTGSWDQCLQGYGVLTKDKAVCDGAIAR